MVVQDDLEHMFGNVRIKLTGSAQYSIAYIEGTMESYQSSEPSKARNSKDCRLASEDLLVEIQKMLLTMYYKTFAKMKEKAYLLFLSKLKNSSKKKSFSEFIFTVIYKIFSFS